MIPVSLLYSENIAPYNESVAAERGVVLPVMEQFYTIQGEGYNTGRAAYFIRLGGCDVGCVWCDVKESWDADAHPRQTIAQLVDAVLQYPGRDVVITGGEPLMHDLGPLTTALQAAGCRTWLETSGAHLLTGTWDWVCLSPKKFKAPLPDVMAAVHELKVVVFNGHDFAWAEEHAALVPPLRGCTCSPSGAGLRA